MPAIYGYDDVGNHAMMLVDEIRTRAFADAIARTVKPDDVVVDIGSGSGVLALLCAKAGARRVYAVERGPMAGLIEEAARENALVAVQVMRVDARTAVFPERPTLIVSEMIGSFGIDEDYIDLLGDVAKACAPSVRFLPESVDVRLALADIPSLTHELDLIGGGALGVKLGALRQKLAQRPTLGHIDAGALLTAALPAARFVPGGARPGAIGGDLTTTRAGRANALVSWFDSVLCEGVHLTSSPSSPGTHWAQVIFPLDPPVDVAAGASVHIEVRPRLITDRGSYAWSLRAGDVVRRGDAMQSLVGSKADVLKQLGIRLPEASPEKGP